MTKESKKPEQEEKEVKAVKDEPKHPNPIKQKLYEETREAYRKMGIG